MRTDKQQYLLYDVQTLNQYAKGLALLAWGGATEASIDTVHNFGVCFNVLFAAA